MNQYIDESPVSKFVFSNTKMAWFWLVVRLYVGWQWLHAGWGKVQSETWVGSEAGKSLTGFLNGAFAKASGDHPDVQGWYAYFLLLNKFPGRHGVPSIGKRYLSSP